MYWFKCGLGSATDPRWLSVARRANVRRTEAVAVAMALQCYSGEHDGSIEGFDAVELAELWAIKIERVAAIVAVLRQVGEIDGERWVRFIQRAKDDSAPRVQRHRARKRAAANDAASTTENCETSISATTTEPRRNQDFSNDVTPLQPLRNGPRIEVEENTIGTDVPIGADAPTPDPVKGLWDRGLVILGRNHRALLGKLRKQHGDVIVLEAICAVEAEQPSDPAAWLVRACEARSTRIIQFRTGQRSGPYSEIEVGRRVAEELMAEGRQ